MVNVIIPHHVILTTFSNFETETFIYPMGYKGTRSEVERRTGPEGR
jgi:hypothetical protein